MNKDFLVEQFTPLPRVKGFFVTGTDTDVGKTLIAGAIARELRASGRRVGVFKPVASGCGWQAPARRELISEDAQFLAACADSDMPLEEIVPQRFKAALAPNVAAAREGRAVDIQAIFDAYARVAEASDCMIVEGVGGLLCPISDDFWVIHFARLTGLPLVIVARAGLGTINHTLLTLHAARSAGLTVAGVIINRYQADPPFEGDAMVAMETNPEQIAKLGKVKVLALVPEDKRSSVRDCVIGPDVGFAVGQVGWAKMLADQK